MPRPWRPNRLVIILCFALFLGGCAERVVTRSTTPPSPAPAPGSYIDLKPGWRLSVITPLFKSGKLTLDSDAQPTEASSGSDGKLSVTLQAGTDFLGYEKSVYAIERRGEGIRVRFAKAETVRDGNTVPQRNPLVRLFQLPRSVRHARLVYLTRASDADHNMAIVAAARFEDLQALTRDVQSDPARGCQARGRSVCQWIPAGVAVRPEMRTATDWVPAR